MKNRVFMALFLAFALAIAAFAAPSMMSVETADESVLYLYEQDDIAQTSTNLVPILREGDPIPENQTASLASEEADIIVSNVIIHSFYAGTKTVTAEVQFEYAGRGMHDAKTKLVMSVVDDNGRPVAKQKSCEVVFSQQNYDVSLMYELEAVSGHTFSEENRYFLEFEYTGAYTFENRCYFSQLIASASQEIIKMETVNASQNIVDFYMANVDKNAELTFVIEEVEYPSEKIADGVYRVRMTELEYRGDGEMPNTMWLFVEVYDSDDMHVCFGHEEYYYIGKDSPEYEDWNFMEFQKVIPLNAQSAYVYLERKENGAYYKQNEMSKISAVIYDAVTCQVVGSSRSTGVTFEEGSVFVDVLITAPIVSDRKYVMVVDDGYTVRIGNMESVASPCFENVMLMRDGTDDEYYYDLFPAETFRIAMTKVYYMPDLTKLQVKILDRDGNLYAQSYGTVSVYGQNPDRTSYDYIQFGMQTVGELVEGEYYFEAYYDGVRIDNDEFRFYYYPGYGGSEGVMVAGAYNDGQYTYVGMIVHNGDFNARNASYTLVSNYSSYGDTVSGTFSRVVFENDWETFVVAKFPIADHILWDYRVEMVDGGVAYTAYGFESDYADDGYVYYIDLYNNEGKLYFAGDNLSDNKTYKIMMFKNGDGKAVEFPLTKVRGKNELVFGADAEELSKYDISMYAMMYITADGKIISTLESYNILSNNGFYNSGHDFYARYRRLNHRIAILALPYADYTSYRIAESESDLKNSVYSSMKNYTEYIVSEGSGKKVIYAQFKDSKGKESEIMRTYVYVDVKAPVLEVSSVTQNVEINEYGSVYINGELTTDEDGYLFVEFYDEEDKRIDIGNSYFDNVDARDGSYFFGKSINVGAVNSPLVNASKIKLYIVDNDGNKSNVVEFAFSAVHGYSLYEKDGVKIVLENDTGYIKSINTSNPRILIPEQIGGIDVKGIKDFAVSISANIDITYIRLPKSLEYFGYEAFYGVWNATYGVYENSTAHEIAEERGYNYELVTLAPGDISGDDTIDDTDVKTVAEYIISVFSSVETMTEEQIKAADVYKGDAEDGETVINIKDLITLAQMARGRH